MALIRRTEFDQIVRSPVTMDLGDLHRQGEIVKAEARRAAEQIIAEARAERERLIADAAEKGHREGFEQGRSEGYAHGRREGQEAAHREHAEQIERVCKSWTAALDEFSRAREDMLREASEDLLRLALRIAEHVVKRLPEVDPGVVVAQMDAALELVARPTRLRLAVHPDDVEAAESAVPALASRLGAEAHAEVEEDDSLDRGSVVLRTEAGGLVDASLQTQLARMAEALLPGAAENSLEETSAEAEFDAEDDEGMGVGQ